jgi:hypothetical protein
MKVPITDILDELGIEDMTNKEQIAKITDEQIQAVLNKIADRIKEAKEGSKEAQKTA